MAHPLTHTRRLTLAILIGVAVLPGFTTAQDQPPKSTFREMTDSQKLRDLGPNTPVVASRTDAPKLISIEPVRDAAMVANFRALLYRPLDSKADSQGSVFEQQTATRQLGQEQIQLPSAGFELKQGLVYLRGWRPFGQTPRTTTVAPGSCVALQTSEPGEGEYERAFLIEGTSAYVWRTDDATDYVELAVGEYAELRKLPDGTWEFKKDEAGRRALKTEGSDAGDFLKKQYDVQNIP